MEPKQVRADQATAALQGKKARTVNGRSCTASSASAVVDTRLLGKPVAFDGPVRSLLWCHRQSLEGPAPGHRLSERGNWCRSSTNPLERRRTWRSAQSSRSLTDGQPSAEGAQSLLRSARRALLPTSPRSSLVSLQLGISLQEHWC